MQPNNISKEKDDLQVEGHWQNAAKCDIYMHIFTVYLRVWDTACDVV